MHDYEILEYLKKEGPTNSFRLAHKLGIERHKLLNIIQKLESQGALEFKSGITKFLKFPTEKKRVVKPAGAISAKNKAKTKPKVLETLQSENKQLKEKLVELEKKVSARPKTITRIRTKTIIKKVPVIKTVVKRIPVILKGKKKKAKKKVSPKKPKTKKFKFSKLKFIKHIKRLKKPEFTKKGGE